MSDSGALLPAQRGRPFVKGEADPRRNLTTGSRPRKLIHLEKILDDKHRTPAKLEATLERLRDLAMGNLVFVKGDDGETIEARIVAHPAFMKLYLDRVLGPVHDDTDEKVEALARKLLDGMLEEARARREASAPEIPDPAK